MCSGCPNHIYFVPIFIPHQLSVRHNLRISCNCAACFFKREIQVAPIHVYICAACFFKREIQVALFTFTHLHRHLISLPSPIHHLFIFTNSPFLYLHQSSLYLHQYSSSLYLYAHVHVQIPYYCVGQISLCVEPYVTPRDWVQTKPLLLL